MVFIGARGEREEERGEKKPRALLAWLGCLPQVLLALLLGLGGWSLSAAAAACTHQQTKDQG